MGKVGSIVDQNMPLRVLQIVTQMGRGGLETMLMNYDRYIDHNVVQFDFLEHWQSVTDYDPEIAQLGGSVYRLPRLNPFDKRYLRELDHFFKTHPEYQIVHAHMDCLSGVPLKYAKKNGVQVRIAHAHSTGEIKNLKYPLKMMLKRNVTRYASDCLACGSEAGQWMFGGRQFSILNNAIDAEQYAFNSQIRSEVREELGIGSDVLVVGHVGSFGFPKNHTFLVDVFYELLKSRQNSKLLLVGEGSLKKEIQNKCEAIGIQENVVFAGRRNDVNRLLQAMDVFVFPSHYEGISLSSIEAQASGLPCIFSESISPECIITEGLVSRMSLQKPADAWANQVIAVSGKKHTDTLMQIKKHGFDVKENAAWLQKFYLDKWKNICK